MPDEESGCLDYWVANKIEVYSLNGVEEKDGTIQLTGFSEEEDENTDRTQETGISAKTTPVAPQDVEKVLALAQSFPGLLHVSFEDRDGRDIKFKLRGGGSTELIPRWTITLPIRSTFVTSKVSEKKTVLFRSQVRPTRGRVKVLK